MEQLLDDVCGYINNYFVVKNGYHSGTYTVENGELHLGFLQDGQYFRIQGSVFNDGIYKYPASELSDEIFDGEIWAMAVPPAVISLVSEIAEWEEKYGGADSVNMSPFSSETFNNYTYMKSSGGGGFGNSGGSNAPMSWRDVYGKKLTRWRKL